jgi:hypothetical protein
MRLDDAGNTMQDLVRDAIWMSVHISVGDSTWPLARITVRDSVRISTWDIWSVYLEISKRMQDEIG